MSHDPNNLYNFKKPKLHDPSAKELSSSTNLAFSSTLSSLLSSTFTSTPSTTRGRPRPSKQKEDIFKSHNKGSKKRAAKDLEDEGNGFTRINNPSGQTVDDNVLHRSKRRLEVKAKIYSRMKRGQNGDPENGEDGLIDFDRKWAEADEKENEDSSSNDDDDNSNEGELIEYTDEYGRLRRGTRTEAARMDRKKNARLIGAEELERMSARPSLPSALIHGDTIQTHAFTSTLSSFTESRMQELAEKRDRSATPPEMVHYEADKEVRRRGTGFYSFSREEGMREQEMNGLEEMRKETERARRERDKLREKRRKEVEERRKLLGEKRARKQADMFLEGLGGQLGEEGAENGEGKGEERKEEAALTDEQSKDEKSLLQGI